jgi:O-antigen/teichoic acid export membrane protein
MKTTNKLISNIITYGISSVLGRCINYLLVPIYTSILCPSEFGIMTEFYSYIAILQIIYSFGIETAYFRFHTCISGYKNFAQTFIILLSLIFSLLIGFNATYITNLISHPGCESYIHISILILLIDSWLIIPFAYLRAIGKAKVFAFIKFMQITINFILNLLVLYSVNNFTGCKTLDKVYYILLSNAIANGIFIPLCIHRMDGFSIKISWKNIKHTILYSLPIVYMGLITVTNDIFSRFAIKYWLPPSFCQENSSNHILGVFAACQKIAVLMSLAIQAFRYAIEPLLFSHIHGSRSWYSLVMYWFIVFGCIIMLMLSLNIDFIAHILLKKEIYKSALGVVPYTLFSYLLIGIYYNLSAWFKIVDKTYYGMFITTIGLVITVIGNAILIPHLGYFGSVYATLIAYLTMVIICYIIGQIYYPIPYHIRLYSVCIAITITAIVLFKNIVYNNILVSYLCNGLLSTVFSFCLYVIARRGYKTKIINSD